jgi:hypothetical protein
MHFWDVAYTKDVEAPGLRERLIALGGKNRKAVPGIKQAEAMAKARISEAHTVVMGLACVHLDEYYRLCRMEHEQLDVDGLDAIALLARLVVNNYVAAYLWEYANLIEQNHGYLMWPVYQLLPKDGEKVAKKRQNGNAPSFQAQDFL